MSLRYFFYCCCCSADVADSGYEEDPVGELPRDLRDDAEERGPCVPVHDGRAGHGGIHRR